MDAHGEPAGKGSDDECQHGEREEPHAGREGSVTQAVLDVQGQVQEHRENGRGDRHGHDGYAHEGRFLEEREVQHRIPGPLFVHEDDHEDDRGGNESDGRRAGPPLVIAAYQREDQKEEADRKGDEADPVDPPRRRIL